MSTAETFQPERDQAGNLPGTLEARLASLAEVVARLEARVATLETTGPERTVQAAPTPALAAAVPIAPEAVLPSSVRFMGLIGRTCLILGGATFIRSLVDAGTIHHGLGVTLGLAYAATWALLADRAKQKLDAGFHALASVLIAYPLIVESTARFGILTPGIAAFLLLATTCLHGAVAWRRELRPIVWIATLTALGSGLAMMAATRSIEPFLAAFLVLGIGTLWATDGRQWQGLRWPTALAANLGVLILTSLAAWPGGIPETYRGISPTRTMLFALCFAVLYVGSFAVRMLRQRTVVTAFEVAQTSMVLLVGFGGALRVALASGSGAGLLGAGATLAGIGCYAVSVPFAGDRPESKKNFQFFTFLGLVYLLLGGPILLPTAMFAPLSGAAGLATMLAGLAWRRPIFILQSSLFLLAAAVGSGLTAWTLRAFLAPGGPATSLPLAGLISLVCLTAAVVLFVLHQPAESLSTRVRLLALLLGAAMTGGIGALAIQACSGIFASGTADPGALAAVRTGVLSTLAIALAWGGRRFPVLEAKWLVYPMLIVTALKFLFEDLAAGRPLTLFLGFMCFGTTLMLAPRLLKSPAPPDRGSDAHPLKPEVDP